MKHLFLPLLLILALAMPHTGYGQLIYEISPTIGYRTGGGFNFTPDATNNTQRFNLASKMSYGVKAALGFSPSFFLEGEWDRQATSLSRQGLVPGDSMASLDVTVDYYHGGLLFQYAYDRFQPFGFFSLGATTFYPAGDFDSVTRFSMGAGGGAKYFLTHMFGLRGQARFYTTSMSSDPSGYWCDFYGCWSTSTINWLTQWSFSAGVFVRFGGNKRKRRY